MGLEIDIFEDEGVFRNRMFIAKKLEGICVGFKMKLCIGYKHFPIVVTILEGGSILRITNIRGSKSPVYVRVPCNVRFTQDRLTKDVFWAYSICLISLNRFISSLRIV